MTTPPERAEGASAALADPVRLAALLQTDLQNTGPDEPFDRLTRLAGRLLGAPISVLSLVTDDREFFKSQHGLEEPYASRRELPMSLSLGRQVVEEGAIVAVEDCEADERLRANTEIRELGVGAYLGVPLRVSEGPVVGALFAMDRRPRAWDEESRRLLSDLAAIAVREIEHRIMERTLTGAQVPARFARLINLLPVGLYLCDPEGRIVFYNERAAEMWGRSPMLPCVEMDAFGLRPLRRLDGAELNLDELPGSVALRQRITVNNREFSLAPDRTVLLSWGPSLGRDDRLLGAVVVMQDVTEIRQAARLRDDLLALVSHELRTPLTVINGMARALERRLQATDDPEQRMALGDIIVAGQRMERVVENMLLLSRLEHEAAETEPVLVAAAVDAALERHRRDYPRSAVEVEIREPGLMVDAVPSWLQRILVNLLNNAEQYGDRRRPHQFTAYADGDTACLSLCNSGTLSLGEDRDSWFEPFYRGAATAALVAGAGLGLTVAKRLAEAQAGTIAAERWPGDPEGTMVTLRLPRARDQAAEH